MASGDRKHSRGKRSPARKRYVAERRWEKNKRLAIERHLKRMAKKSAKLAKRAARTTAKQQAAP